MIYLPRLFAENSNNQGRALSQYEWSMLKFGFSSLLMTLMTVPRHSISFHHVTMNMIIAGFGNPKQLYISV